jgi:hypothetical protein
VTWRLQENLNRLVNCFPLIIKNSASGFEELNQSARRVKLQIGPQKLTLWL